MRRFAGMVISKYFICAQGARIKSSCVASALKIARCILGAAHLKIGRVNVHCTTVSCPRCMQDAININQKVSACAFIYQAVMMPQAIIKSAATLHRLQATRNENTKEGVSTVVVLTDEE